MIVWILNNRSLQPKTVCVCYNGYYLREYYNNLNCTNFIINNNNFSPISRCSTPMMKLMQYSKIVLLISRIVTVVTHKLDVLWIVKAWYIRY